jgi:hypothetical protein
MGPLAPKSRGEVYDKETVGDPWSSLSRNQSLRERRSVSSPC